MSKNKKATSIQTTSSSLAGNQSAWALPIVIAIIVAFIAGVFLVSRQGAPSGSVSGDVKNNSNAGEKRAGDSLAATQPSDSTKTPELLSMEVAKAVMVTAELEFPDGIPTVAAALAQIERRYQPDDGLGRTFAILDAYGEPAPDGKLHMSMHVSSEKPGLGSLVFKRTGEVLWNSRITNTPNAPTAKNLNIYLGDGAGATWIIDGSASPTSILDAKVRDKGVKVRDFWPDGAERELTFVYSACGCPVKVMVRRAGERTFRTNDQPVMFPDDPGALQTIGQLMRW